MTLLPPGVQSKLYRNTGSVASPVWNECTHVSDVDLGMTKGKGEVKARVSSFVKHVPGMKQPSLDFEIIADTTVDDYNVLRDAWVNDTVIHFAVCDQAIATSGADYWKGEYLIEEFSLSQKLESPPMVKVKCALSYVGLAGTAATDPAWVDVA